MVFGVRYPCYLCIMPHIRLIKQWDNRFIHVSASLDHYITDKVHYPCSLFFEPRVTVEHAQGVVEGHAVVGD